MVDIFFWFQEGIKGCIKPANPDLTSGLHSELTCSRTDRVMESSLLR